jgi:hypothetical protein
MEATDFKNTAGAEAVRAAAANLPRKATEPPPRERATAFDSVAAPLTRELEEVARLDQELAKLEGDQQELQKRMAEEYAAASSATAAGDSKSTAAHTRAAAQYQSSLVQLDERHGAVSEKRRKAAMVAGLIPVELWIYVTSEEKYYRVLPDGRSLGPAHKKDGYRAALEQALCEERATDVAMVEAIRAVHGTESLIAECEGTNVLNTFRMPTVQPKRGSCRGVLKVILNLTSGNREHAEYILGWLAAPVQSVFNRGRPLLMGSFIGLVGAPGTGKDLLFAAQSAVLGRTNATMLQQDDIESRFTRPGLPDKLIVMINEVQSSSGIWNSTVANKLKLWATAPDIRDEGKGRDVRMRPRAFNTILASNEDLPFRVDKGDRRYSVFKAEKKIEVDGKGQVLDPDIKGLIAELDELRGFHEQGGTGTIPATPQLSAFSYLLRHLRPHRLVKPGQILETAAKDAIIGEFRSSLDEFIGAIRTDGLEGLVATWEAANPQRHDRGDGTHLFSEDELYRRLPRGLRLPGGGRVFHPTSVAMVEPNRLHALYVEWAKWTGRRDRIVPPRVFVTKVNDLFDGGHKTRNLGGLSQPRVLMRVPWSMPPDVVYERPTKLYGSDHIDLAVERKKRQQGAHAAA